MSSTPCNNCPWRKDAPRGHWHPDHFTSIYRNCQDDGLAMMLCHKAASLPEEQKSSLLCKGWLLVMGKDSIGVRIAMMTGKIKATDLNRSKKCPTLFETFEAMLKANCIPVPKRNHVVDCGRIPAK